MFVFRLTTIVVLLAASAAGCAKVQARTEPVMPELAPPPPPPRVVEQYAADPEPIADPVPTDNALSVPPARTTAKPPPARVETPPPAEPPRSEPERPPATPPSLTIKPAAGSQSATEASIRDLLGRAGRDLSRVNYNALTNDGKTQYDTARRFIQQSEDALRNGNLVFAGKLADKAATMASVLVR